jgi:hypothetical protein
MLRQLPRYDCPCSRLRLLIFVPFVLQLLMLILGTLRYPLENNDNSLTTTTKRQGPPQYLVDQARERSNMSQTLSSSINDNVQKLAFNHPAFQNIDAAFKPQSHWAELHHPDIAIVGLPKAGTSQLYNILKSHPKLTPFHPSQKEFCFDFDHGIDPRQGSELLQQDFYNTSYRLEQHKQLYVDATTKVIQHQQVQTVNACMDLAKAMLMRQYLGRTNDSKIIFLIRDPADWLWAAYNFWQQPERMDAGGTPFGWATSPYQYRSPEMFHEMLLAGSRFWPTVGLLNYYRDKLVSLGSRVVDVARHSHPENVLVLKTEEMAPDQVESSGFLDKLADFVGVEKTGFNKSTYGSFSNCGNQRGLQSQCKKASSAYSVAGNRPMLEESRELIYLHFAEECKFWSEEFGIVYEGCLAVRKKYNLDH